MPVTLRNPNNKYTDDMVLNILRNIIHNNALGQPCTYLASIDPAQTGLGLTYVQNRYDMILNMNTQIPYAIHLSSGKQAYEKNLGFLYEGGLSVLMEYCGRWDEQQSSIDNIRKVIALDLERIKSNIEDNDSIQYGSAATAISVTHFGLSDYKGSLNTDYQGLVLVERTLTLGVNILPYDALS